MLVNELDVRAIKSTSCEIWADNGETTSRLFNLKELLLNNQIINGKLYLES